MVKKIIKFPAPSLRAPCTPVTFPPTFPLTSEELLGHIQDLKDTLAATPHGVALASNQIRQEGLRVFVSLPGIGLPEVMVNPSYRTAGAASGEMIGENEGCLSVPELTMKMFRFKNIIAEYDDVEGVHHTLEYPAPLAARVIQHECEHLDGKLLYDHANQKVQIKVRAEAIRNRKAGR